MDAVGIATGAGRGMGRACAQQLAQMVDVVLAVDLDEGAVTAVAEELSKESDATVVPFVLDVTDAEGLARLASVVTEHGALRAVAHAAGISPTMADWRRIFTVDLVGTAMLVEALRPLASTGTAFVCFASMAPWLTISQPHPAADAALDAPLADDLLDRLHEALGPDLEDTGTAYTWAKRGVQRFVQAEAVRLGPVGARICAVSPGIIDTPQGRQEAEQQPIMETLVQQTPLGRIGTADDVASVVSFLLSDEARFVTGIDVLVDGGIYAAITRASAAAHA